jgi:hypothetical protein
LRKQDKFPTTVFLGQSESVVRFPKLSSFGELENVKIGRNGNFGNLTTDSGCPTKTVVGNLSCFIKIPDRLGARGVFLIGHAHFRSGWRHLLKAVEGKDALAQVTDKTLLPPFPKRPSRGLEIVIQTSPRPLPV